MMRNVHRFLNDVLIPVLIPNNAWNSVWHSVLSRKSGKHYQSSFLQKCQDLIFARNCQPGPTTLYKVFISLLHYFERSLCRPFQLALKELNISKLCPASSLGFPMLGSTRPSTDSWRAFFMNSIYYKKWIFVFLLTSCLQEDTNFSLGFFQNLW